MVAPLNSYQNNYNFFQAKPVTERKARPIYGGENFFVNPPVGFTYPPQDVFSSNTSGLSGLVANAPIGAGGSREIHQNLAAQAGYEAGTSSRSWVC